MTCLKGFMLCAAILLVIIGLSAQAYEWSWANSAGGGHGFGDYGYAIASDSQDNLYISGTFSGTASFGPTTLNSSGDTDIFVAKLDSNGNWLWAKKAGGSLGDGGIGIAVDGEDNVCLTGYFRGSATFGSNTITASGNEDLFVAKLDASGNWLWAKKAGGSGNDYGASIAVDINANIYSTGYFEGNANFGTTALSSNGSYDIFVTKLDSNGNWLWAKRAGGSGNDSGHDLAVDSDANVFITGGFLGTANFGSISLSSNGSNDIFVAKLDTNGNWLMVRGAGGPSTDVSHGIALDADGNVYLTGLFDFYSYFGSITLQPFGYYDIFIAKLDSSGNWVWAQEAGGVDSDMSYDIAVDENTDIYLTGNFKGSSTFGTTSLSSIGFNDIFVAKLDTNGSWLTAIRAGGINQDYCRGITVDENGCVFLIGSFDWDSSFGTVSLVSNGHADVFIAKLSPPDPIASFTADVTEGLSPLDIQFTDSSLPGGAPITDWFWDFGDGGTSFAQNPIHTYLVPGTYSISLSVTNGLNLNSIKVRINYISVLDQIYYIDLISSSPVNFGSVYVEEQSAYQEVEFINSGTMDINISDVHLLSTPLHFEFVNPFRDIVLSPGETDSIMVRFTPHAVGSMTDTLFIVNNSTNLPILSVTLNGTGLHVLPKAPQNLSITVSGNDAYLSWDEVTQNTHDQEIVPDYYIIYISSDPFGSYTMMTLTPNLNYTHSYVGLGAERLFYRVTAVKFYRDDLSPSELDAYLRRNVTPGMTETDVRALLNDLD